MRKVAQENYLDGKYWEKLAGVLGCRVDIFRNFYVSLPCFLCFSYF